MTYVLFIYLIKIGYISQQKVFFTLQKLLFENTAIQLISNSHNNIMPILYTCFRDVSQREYPKITKPNIH